MREHKIEHWAAKAICALLLISGGAFCCDDVAAQDGSWPSFTPQVSKRAPTRPARPTDALASSDKKYVRCVRTALLAPSSDFFWHQLKKRTPEEKRNGPIFNASPDAWMTVVGFSCSESKLGPDLDDASLADRQNQEIRFNRRAALFHFISELQSTDTKSLVARFTLGHPAAAAAYRRRLDETVRNAIAMNDRCLENRKKEFLPVNSGPADEVARVILLQCAVWQRHVEKMECPRYRVFGDICYHGEPALRSLERDRQRALEAEVAADILRRRTITSKRPTNDQRAPLPSPEDVFKRVSKAVFVVIATTLDSAGKVSSTAQGSAVAISDRLLLTNCHVIGDSKQVFLHSNGQFGLADVNSKDIEADRCTLNSSKPLTVYVEVRPFHDVQTGEKVYAIGAPKSMVLGLDLSMADGIVSAKRSIGSRKLLQTTAPISTGSSGGGLFDSLGRLVGITTFTIKGGQNLNFALAADQFPRQ